ncbi:MAG: flavodoxin family protein [Rhizobiales bacterium]|nr:flavodoxin family protein [Hyphomicrobiales bacterium]
MKFTSSIRLTHLAITWARRMSKKTLLIVGHVPSINTQILRDAVLRGARHPDISGVETVALSPFDTHPEHVKTANAIVLGTTENLGYMSGALKDFFDRIYYPCLEETQAKPFALYVRAGLDGTGTCRAVDTITTGLRWKAVQDHLVCRGEYNDQFEADCEELGTLMAAGLEAGVF